MPHVNLELIPKSHSTSLFLKQNILAMEEALNWVKYTGDATILSKLGAVDNCWPMLSIFFTECKYKRFRLLFDSVFNEMCSYLS